MLKSLAKDSQIVEDPTKMKYFDISRMTEVYMERCSDILYAKLVKVNHPPEW